MFYWQGESKEYHFLSSHLDIMPTLLSQFFGVQNPLNDYAQGMDLSTQNQRLWVSSSNHKWNVAIMPNGEQYQIDRKGNFKHFNSNGEHEKETRPPLALFLQMIQQSNQFIAKWWSSDHILQKYCKFSGKNDRLLAIYPSYISG